MGPSCRDWVLDMVKAGTMAIVDPVWVVVIPLVVDMDMLKAVDMSDMVGDIVSSFEADVSKSWNVFIVNLSTLQQMIYWD
ncbi:hypothetical protein M5689_024229 [Euphorbia peplus]|nr:hypothetical protein M5689_024229 [Euphorbia peplus]